MLFISLYTRNDCMMVEKDKFICYLVEHTFLNKMKKLHKYSSTNITTYLNKKNEVFAN